MELSRGRDTLERLRARQAAFAHRLLGVSAKAEALLTRGKPELAEERELRERLAALLDTLRRTENVTARLSALGAVVQSSRHEGGAAGSSNSSGGGGGGGADVHFSPADLRGVQHQLEVQRGGVEQLLTVLGKDARDLKIIRDRLDEEVAARKAAGQRQRLYTASSHA